MNLDVHNLNAVRSRREHNPDYGPVYGTQGNSRQRAGRRYGNYARKGLIKVSQIPPNRYAYYLTPKGFSEKSRLTTEYLSSSFTFFRRARGQCGDLLEYCAARNWHRIALAGTSELAEIATLCAIERNIRLTGLIDTGQIDARGRKGEPVPTEFAGLPVVTLTRKFPDLDAIIVTDLQIPQAVFDTLAAEFPAEHILTPPLLRILREAPSAESAS